MNMKTKYFFMLMIACLMGVQMVSAQQDSENRRQRKRMSMEQVAEMQAAKVVKELGLDDKTAAKFAEVYKKYMKEMDDLRKQYMPAKSDFKKDKPSMPKSLTDAEVDKMMRQAELDANWAAFVEEITPSAEIYTEFMQAEVLKLVEQATN